MATVVLQDTETESAESLSQEEERERERERERESSDRKPNDKIQKVERLEESRSFTTSQ